MLDLVRSAAVPELQWLPLWLGVAELYWVSTSWCGAPPRPGSMPRARS